MAAPMKVFIEFPEDTRFARQPRDILYTPIYFFNERITAHVRLGSEWKSTYGEDLERQFYCRIKLIGKASLGFLSVGGKPIAGVDMRYALPNLGFKPIYTLEILNIYKRISMYGLEYDVEDGIRGGRKPFSFQLPASTLDDLQQLASSLKVITADNMSTMGFLQGLTPALIVSVQYTLCVEIMNEADEVKGECKEEIRLFVSLSEEQVPASNHAAVVANPMATNVDTQVFSLTTTQGRRGSIPLIRRLSRTSSQEPNLVTVTVTNVEPFAFTRQSDAAASKVTITLTYTTDNVTTPPPTIHAGIQWMLKSLTTLTLEPLDREEEQQDDYFHLRSKILPSRKLKMKWTDWQAQNEGNGGRVRWKATQDAFLVKDITAGMTPTFVTPYLSHTYILSMQINLNENEAKVTRAISSGKQRVDLDVPVQVRYDLGLVPSYEVDESLPEYDHTLPHYEDIVEAVEEGEAASSNVETAAGVDAVDEVDELLPELATIDLTPVESTTDGQTLQFPPRQLAHSPVLPTSSS